jgi:hypothetical protein
VGALAIFATFIHFQFKERLALKLLAIEEQLFGITSEVSLASEIRTQ